jgi:hypothetical protein
MVNEDNMFYIMGRIHNVLEAAKTAGMLTIDEEISLKRVLDVAADKWFEV